MQIRSLAPKDWSKAAEIAIGTVFLLSAAVALSAPSGRAQEAGAQEFGTENDVAFAQRLWQSLSQARFVGEDAITARPYAGTSQHGPVLQYLDGRISIGGERSIFIVKRNYRGEGVTVQEIWNDPSRHFDSYGVMFRRDGYDPQNRNWFWVKFMPDGSVASAPTGAAMAGRVGACISCHRPAPGNDLVWSHDRFAR